MVNIGRGSHLRFMLASFAIKQSEHAKSRLKLGSSPDTMLIARTMIEGLSQMLWAAKRPRQRPLLWLTFVFGFLSRICGVILVPGVVPSCDRGQFP